MTLDNVIFGMIYIMVFFLLFFIGKIIYNFFHKDYQLNVELVENDNPAVSLAVTGYYAGLTLCLGACIVGPSKGIFIDLINLFMYGFLSIILLNISSFICDKIILYKFKIKDELIRDRNQGTGAVVFGTSLASGFVIYGAVSGENGSIWTALAFWIMGQVLLIAATFVYNAITSFSIHEEIEKDNTAAGVAFSGALISMGIIVGLSAEGDFISWRQNTSTFVLYALVGLVSLPLMRTLTDRLLLPGVKLSDEIIGLKADKSIEERGPNTGAAYIEAFAYIAGAFIIFWCI